MSRLNTYKSKTSLKLETNPNPLTSNSQFSHTAFSTKNKNRIKLATSTSTNSQKDISTQQSKSNSNFVGYIKHSKQSNIKSEKAQIAGGTKKSHSHQLELKDRQAINKNSSFEFVNTNEVKFTYDDTSEVRINFEVDDTTSHITYLKNEEKNLIDMLNNNSNLSYSSNFLNYKLGMQEESGMNLSKIRESKNLHKVAHPWDTKPKIKKISPIEYDSSLSSSKISLKSKHSIAISPSKKNSKILYKGGISGINVKFAKEQQQPVKVIRKSLDNNIANANEATHLVINKPKMSNYKENINRYNSNSNYSLENYENMEELESSFTSYFRNTEEVSVNLYLILLLFYKILRNVMEKV